MMGCVARLLQHFIEPARACSYLGDRAASLEYRIMVDVTPQQWEAMLERGWRRFGPGYFRPACAPCGECVSLRLPVDEFVPSRSQRRAMRSATVFRSEVGPVRVDADRLELYARWHAGREQTRNWEPSHLDARDYAGQFGFPQPCAREVAYYDDRPVDTNTGRNNDGKTPRLVGVGLCDETPHAWSAIYFFHDPAYARHSPGVFHILNLIALARQQGKAHVYLGFRVQDCASMRYKALFRPHELLMGRPAAHEPPSWLRVSG